MTNVLTLELAKQALRDAIAEAVPNVKATAVKYTTDGELVGMCACSVIAQALGWTMPTFEDALRDGIQVAGRTLEVAGGVYDFLEDRGFDIVTIYTGNDGTLDAHQAGLPEGLDGFAGALWMLENHA